MRIPDAAVGSALRRAALAVAAIGACLPGCAAAAETDMAPPPARQDQLIRLLKNDCGSCHGMRLTGGLGPALTSGALKDKPADSLTATILSGRPGTPMPPWRPFLSDAEARWLVDRMQSGDFDGR
jgi:cytochrome c55X